MKSLHYLNVLSLDKIRAEKCKRSFYYFFQEFWSEIESVELIDNWHIKYICDQLQEVYSTWAKGESQPDLIINVPPGSSKSTICTQLFPVWLWTKTPHVRIISSSYSSDLSTAHAVKSRHVVRSDKFKLYFSDMWQINTGEDNKTWYKNSKNGERYATSTGGTVTGMHADFIIVDDPINPKKAASRVERDTANKHLSETLSTRKTDKNRTVTILIMQRLHEEDPTGKLIKDRKEAVRHICLPGELSNLVHPIELRNNYTDGLLDINRLNRTALSRLKTDLGSYGYAGQISQNPAPQEGGILKRAWFGTISSEDFIKTGVKCDIFLDTAYTDKQENDPTALTAIAHKDHIYYIYNSVQQWLEFPELLKFIPEFTDKNNYSRGSKILIEPKASGKSIAQSLKKTQYNVIELPPPEDDKITRVSNVSPKIEAGKVVLVAGPWNEQFLDECTFFPNAAHDDQLDNLVNAINYYLNGSGRTRAGVV